jgi:hypothetical protein
MSAKGQGGPAGKSQNRRVGFLIDQIGRSGQGRLQLAVGWLSLAPSRTGLR